MKQNDTNYRDNLLTVGQRKVFKALLQTGSITEAAKESGISRKTIYRYLSDPKFKKVLSEARFQQLSLAIQMLQKAAIRSSEVLIEILNNKKSSDTMKISAARLILETSIRGAEILNLDERLTALEGQEND